MGQAKTPPFVKLPWAVLCDDTLTTGELRMYAALVRRGWKDHVVWASYQTLANDLRIGRRTAIRQVTALCERGLVVRLPRQKKGTNRNYSSKHILVSLDRVYKPENLHPRLAAPLRESDSPPPKEVVSGMSLVPGMSPQVVSPMSPPSDIHDTSATDATSTRPRTEHQTTTSELVVSQMAQEEEVDLHKKPAARSGGLVKRPTLTADTGHDTTHDHGHRAGFKTPETELPRVQYPPHYQPASVAFDSILAAWKINGKHSPLIASLRNRFAGLRSAALFLLGHAHAATNIADLRTRMTRTVDPPPEHFAWARMILPVKTDGPKPKAATDAEKRKVEV